MGKLKLAMNLIKLNNKLGLLDAGDVVNLASTAYKVKNFSPMDAIDDFDLDYYLHREEYERVERRKTFLTAAALAGGAYLIYKNRETLADSAQKALDTGKDVAQDVKYKAKDLAEDAKDVGEDIADDAKDVAKDAKDKAEYVAEDAKDKAKDVKEDVIDKADELTD